MTFNPKAFVDEHVVPDLGGMLVHGVLVNGSGSDGEVLVMVMAAKEVWGQQVKRLLALGWRFDYLREAVAVRDADGKKAVIFGGDGSPFFTREGRCLARLYKKSGRGIILDVGADMGSINEAKDGVKAFFGLFDVDVQTLMGLYGARFGGGGGE